MHSLRKMIPSANALFVFEAAAREGSFTKAAAELNVTQPAVSRMLGRLEQYIGVRLFERLAEGVALTEDGRILYRRIADGFRGIETAIEEINRRRTGLETVTLSLSSGFTTHWLMPRIGALQKACPNVDLRFQLIPGALKGPVEGVDLGMRFIDPNDVEHESAFFINEVTLPVCSPAYLAQRSGKGDAATTDTFIHLGENRPDWMESFDAGPTRRSSSSNLLHFSDYAVVVQAALLGQGIALGWINVVSHWLRTEALVPVRRSVVKTGRQCRLAHLRSRPMRAPVVIVQDWLIAEIRADVAVIDRLHPDLGMGIASF
jgi:DNA-binding transcriptional LysR family regulator